LQKIDIAATEEQLARARAQLAELPLATTTAPAAAPSSRWEQIFGEFVRVSRDSDTRELLARSDPLLARALVDAALREAQAALLVRDDERFHRALAAARNHLAETFDKAAAPVAAQLDGLAALNKLQLAAPAPDVLGAALKELRNLRKTEAVQHEAPPAPAATPAPAIPAPASAGEKT
jgi:uncharacterized protein HemX